MEIFANFSFFPVDDVNLNILTNFPLVVLSYKANYQVLDGNAHDPCCKIDHCYIIALAVESLQIALVVADRPNHLEIALRRIVKTTN